MASQRPGVANANEGSTPALRDAQRTSCWSGRPRRTGSGRARARQVRIATGRCSSPSRTTGPAPCTGHSIPFRLPEHRAALRPGDRDRCCGQRPLRAFAGLTGLTTKAPAFEAATHIKPPARHNPLYDRAHHVRQQTCFKYERVLTWRQPCFRKISPKRTPAWGYLQKARPDASEAAVAPRDPRRHRPARGPGSRSAKQRYQGRGSGLISGTCPPDGARSSAGKRHVLRLSR